MENKHSNKLFVATVVEVIRDIDNIPTLELKVRIPTLHGVLPRGLKDNLLPLAKPLLVPGAIVDTSKFDTQIVGRAIYVVLENGDTQKPMYLGLPAAADDFSPGVTIPYATELVPGIVRVKKVGNTGYIYTSDPVE